MSHSINLGDLFDEESDQYGLRGDTYLWRELRAHYSEVSLPATASDLEQQLKQAFLLLTGQPMASPEPFRIERFAHGGISSGRISPAFWRGQALSLLEKRRLEKSTAAQTNKSVEEDRRTSPNDP